MMDIPINECCKNDWIARWIWDAGSGCGNTWMCLRKRIYTDTLPSHAWTFIAANSKYQLWVNGKRIISDGGLNRGPVPGAGYYDAINLESYLVRGKNTFAALVWYWGNEGRNSVDSGKPGFLFQLETNQGRYESGSSWKVLVHPAFGQSEPPMPSYLYAGYNISFNACRDIPDWYQPEYDDSHWEMATEIGLPPCNPWGSLYERPIPMIKDYGLSDYEKIEMCRCNTGIVVKAYLPYAAHVMPVFTVHSESTGLKIDVRTDRYVINGGPGDESNIYNSHRTEYFTRRGIQEFESPDWLFGEQVLYDFPDGVDMLSIKYRETGYDTDFSGEFQCSNGFFNKLYDKCRRTLYICMRDNYMDCPDRERGQWIGDVSSQVPQTFYALSRSVDRLTKKAISDFILWKDGNILKGNVPGAHCSELPSQSLNAIGEYGMIMSYYMNTGDSRVLYESYEAIKNYLLLWEMDANGLICPRSGDWYWFDHGHDIDNSVLENAWYYSALKAAAAIADWTGNINDIEIYDSRMKSIFGGYDRLFWKGKGYGEGEFFDDRANAMAVLSGLAGKEKWPEILKVLMKRRNATPYMEGYVLEALFCMGYAKEAVSRMRERYCNLVENENSTLWEDFDILGTKNHAWSGGPLTILGKYIAGIKADEAGYVKYSIMPQMGDLSFVNVVVPSIKGEIRVNIVKEAKAGILKLNITSPAGTKAIVGIPKNTFPEFHIKRILCSTCSIWEEGSYMANLPGMEYDGENEGFIRFCIDSGIWNFTVII